MLSSLTAGKQNKGVSPTRGSHSTLRGRTENAIPFALLTKETLVHYKAKVLMKVCVFEEEKGQNLPAYHSWNTEGKAGLNCSLVQFQPLLLETNQKFLPSKMKPCWGCSCLVPSFFSCGFTTPRRGHTWALCKFWKQEKSNSKSKT